MLLAAVSRAPRSAGRGRTWCSRHRTRRSRPISPRHTRRCSRRRWGARPTSSCSKNTTAGLDLAAAAAAATRASLHRLLRRAGVRGRGGAIDQRHLRRTATPPLARRCRRWSRSTPPRCKPSRRPPGAASAPARAPGRAGNPGDRVCRAGRCPGRGNKGRADRLRRPRHRDDREHRGREGAGRRPRRRAPGVAAGDRLGLAAHKVRQVGKSGAHVTPKLYLSLGVSGAPEHVEGMQASS